MVPLWLELLRSRIKVEGLVRDDSRQAGSHPGWMGSGRWLAQEYGPIGGKVFWLLV